MSTTNPFNLDFLSQVDTLPDYLEKGLDIVFVGLNPSIYSMQMGHYFANPRNRFWSALNRSGLVGRELSPEQDASIVEFSIGFTDVVKRPTSQASGLNAADFRRWCPLLKEKLLKYQPGIVCFHGLTGYKAYLKYGESSDDKPHLGLQDRTIGKSLVFVVPNPSPANAQYSLDDLVSWYQELGKLRKELAD
jgi:TDG/mug DNA glycosylase family protein